MQRRFAARLKRHRLRREIIATAITNSLINRMGPVFPVRAQDDTGADPAAIARAYTIAREVFAVREIWSQIEDLDNRIPASVQYIAMNQTARLLRHASYWLHRAPGARIWTSSAPCIATPRRCRSCWAELGSALSATASARLGVDRSRLVEQNVPERLATRIASLEILHCALDLVEVAMAAKVEIGFAAKAYFNISERIGTFLDQGADRRSGGRGTMAGRRPQDRSRRVVRPAAQDHGRGTRVQGP